MVWNWKRCKGFRQGRFIVLLLSVPLVLNADVALTGTPTKDDLTFGMPSTTLTFSYTATGGADNVLIVSCGLSSATETFSGATYNSVAMTSVGSHRANSRLVEIFRLVNPSSGANNVVATASGSVQMGCGAAEWDGADATTPVSGFTGADVSFADVSEQIICGSTDMAVDIVYQSSGTPAPGMSQTSTWTLSTAGGDNENMGASHQQATNPTMTWDTDAVNGSWAGACVEADAGGGAVRQPCCTLGVFD